MSHWYEEKLIRNQFFRKHQSDPMNIKPLLLVLPGRKYPVRGWYFGGIVNQWRSDDSPCDQKPTHWMPFPELPKDSK